MSSNALLLVQKLLNHFASSSDDSIPNMNNEVLYFGYGSNLSLQNFQAFKKINVISYFRAIVPGWKLSFSLCYPLKAFANIHLSPNDTVHGIVMRLTQQDLDKLCRLELSYRLQTVTAYSYEDSTHPIEVNTFIFDKQCEERIKMEIESQPHIKQVTRFFDPNGGGKKPEKNYMDTILRGAREMQLDSKYITTLEQFESIPILKYQPTEQQMKEINSKEWTMDEIEEYLSHHPNECVSVMKGIVFNMAQYPPSWKHRVRGKDLTMSYAARWAFANRENCKSVETLEDGQKQYINGEVQKLLNGVYGVWIMGKIARNADCTGFEDYSF